MLAHQKLEEIVAFLETARSLPMSSSVVVNRAELLKLLDELRESLPEQLQEAEALLKRRDAILTEATSSAERLLEAAAEEKQRLVSEEEVVRTARIEAGQMIQTARDQAEQMSRQVDGYVDAKLAHLEVSVSNILDAIRRGRAHLSESSGMYEELVPDEAAEDIGRPPPELESPVEPPVSVDYNS